MGIFETYGKELFALAVPVVTWMLDRYFKTKARLLRGRRHEFTFLIPEPLFNAQGQQVSPTQTAYTQSLVVWNNGRETATKVEWLFNWKPPFLNVWPPRHFEERTEADNRYTIIFDSMAPDEVIQVELLSINRELPKLLTLRCDQCIAIEKNLWTTIWMPVWQRRFAVVLMFAGLAATVYALLVLIQLLVLKTPTLY